MRRMTANYAIEIVMNKGYKSTTPYISYKDAREIQAEYPENVGMCWDDSKAKKDLEYMGEIYFINTKRAVMHYNVKK